MAPSSKCARFRLVIGSLPVSLFFWKSHRIWQPLKDLIRELTQELEGHPEPLHCDVNPLNRLALCPYVEEKHAWEAFDLLQGFEWSLEGHTSRLQVWLIEWDSQGHPHKLAGPGNDNNSVTPVFAPSTTAPAYSPRSRRTVAKNALPPAWSGDSGTLQMGKRPLTQGGVRYPPASSMMQSQDASSAYPAVSRYATLTRPQICNPGHYSGAAAPSNTRCFDSKGSYLEQRLGQTDSGQPPTPPGTVSSASSISSVCTTFVSSIAPSAGEARVPGPSSVCSGNSTSLSGTSTPGPYPITSSQSDTSSPAAAVRIRGRSSIASEDSAFTSMLGDLSNFGLSSGPSSVLSSPTMFRHSSQLSSVSQHAQGTHELRVHPIPPGTTKETFNAEVLEANLGRYTPHAGIKMMDRDNQMQVYVTYHDEEQAKKAAEKLEKVYYKGRKLQACLKEGIEGGVRI